VSSEHPLKQRIKQKTYLEGWAVCFREIERPRKTGPANNKQGVISKLIIAYNYNRWKPLSVDPMYYVRNL